MVDSSRANRELRDLNQMKEPVLANCSHELKTTASSRVWATWTYAASGGMGHLDPSQEKGFKIRHRNLERLAGPHRKLLASPRRGSGPRAAVAPLRPAPPLIVEGRLSRMRAWRGRNRST